VFPAPFKLDLQCFAGDLATQPAQSCSLSTSEATTGGVGPPRGERGPHTPRVACAWRAMLHSSGQVLGVFQVGGVSNGSRGGPGVVRVLHPPVTGRFSFSGSIYSLHWPTGLHL